MKRVIRGGCMVVGQGLFIIAAGPDPFVQHLRAETEKWSKVVKAAGARVD
jgi:hypothetical protein